MTNKKYQHGFTLVEVLAVMAIIAVLAGMILGISGYATAKSDESKAIADIEYIKQLLADHRTDHGYYPKSSSKNSIFTNTIANLDNTFYVNTSALRDPWEARYCYWRDDVSPGNGNKFIVYVWSRGPDGKTRGSSGAAKIANDDNVSTSPPYDCEVQ